MRVIRFLQKNPLVVLTAGVLTIGLAVALIVGMNNNVEGIGSTVGEAAGSVVGNAAGTINGLTVDAPRGLSEGRQEGLSANDTTVYIKENYLDTGKLEVLAASVKITNFNEFSDKLKDLTEMRGNLFFSVDMKDAEVLRDDDGFIIRIPRPTAELFIDNRKTRTLAQIEKKITIFDNAIDGIEEWANTEAKIEENFSDNISNYSDLVKQAEDAARSQVMSMLGSYNVGGKKIKSVVFKAEEEAQ